MLMERVALLSLEPPWQYVWCSNEKRPEEWNNEVYHVKIASSVDFLFYTVRQTLTWLLNC